MQIERGVMGQIPWAATGGGRPLVVLAGLSPHTGVASDRFVRAALAPVAKLTGRRQVFVLNRRRYLPDGLTMTACAAEHADALRAYFTDPVDLIGLSTGGSIAQQLAAEHPDTIRRLVLISTACRLGPTGRQMQAAVAAELRADEIRRAMAVAAGGLFPRIGWLARGIGWTAGRRLVTDSIAAADLAATLEAEDVFDLARCPAAIQAPTLIIAAVATGTTPQRCSRKQRRSSRVAGWRCSLRKGTSQSLSIQQHGRTSRDSSPGSRLVPLVPAGPRDQLVVGEGL